ncbi:hypothetical protein MHUMG1_09344 [Metarhizium humberi]|uniref:Uncharacterized protein n=1 Tax=Metarhizium humberi TaxID=2596975 RepID=A0A9P8S2V8_9HYPO|nr:hypothetical protein MHUMG1_09344 [Metarhizium humberi]
MDSQASTIVNRNHKDGIIVMARHRAAALEAKEDKGSDKPTGSKKKTRVQQLREWHEIWNKVLPFGHGQDGENKDDYEPTGENENKSSRREASMKEQYGGDASQAFRMHGG